MSFARSAAVAVLAVAAASSWLYAPPLLPAVAQTARAQCNAEHGSDFRAYRLRWRTVTVHDVSWPHWECTGKRAPGDPVSLGWWVTRSG